MKTPAAAAAEGSCSRATTGAVVAFSLGSRRRACKVKVLPSSGLAAECSSAGCPRSGTWAAPLAAAA